jgi:ABC-2 type transport system ATP-binding protein
MIKDDFRSFLIQESPLPPTPVAEFEDLGKVYQTGLLGRGRRTGIEHVTFSVNPGEVFGLVGPNRAGKTTLVKVLLSLCRPTSGKAQRFQRPLADRSTLARVGYVHENPAFPRYLTAPALLEYFGGLALLPQPVVRKRAGELLERVGLSDRVNEPIAAFSKGMVQRLALAQALMNDPDLMVLDEPGEGLDLAGRQLVLDIVKERRQRKQTALLVTHVTAEIEQACDRLAVVVGGRVVFTGTVADLRKDPGSSGPLSVEKALGRLYQTPPRTTP